MEANRTATPGNMSPDAALEWLDSAVEEFFGALDECAHHVANEALEHVQLEAKMNGFMVRLMAIAQEGQRQLAEQAVEPSEPVPAPGQPEPTEPTPGKPQPQPGDPVPTEPEPAADAAAA